MQFRFEMLQHVLMQCSSLLAAGDVPAESSKASWHSWLVPIGATVAVLFVGYGIFRHWASVLREWSRPDESSRQPDAAPSGNSTVRRSDN